jgi:ornithine cyclodeaminase/alanine dehydrogenase-like protein (mu-crystallin family)
MRNATELLIFDGDDVERLYDWDTALASQRRAFTALGEGVAELPHKLALPGSGDSIALCYASRVSPDAAAVSKLVSFNPANTARGLPTIHGLVMVLDPEDGTPVAVLDGTSITTRRTAAASALAVSVLAPDSAERVGVLGSGVQARAHVRALTRVRPIAEVTMWSPIPNHRGAAAAELSAELAIPVSAVDSAEAAVRSASVVVTCTNSSDPVVSGAWLDSGATVVSVGSFEPGRREVDAGVIQRAARVVVDDLETGAERGGPIVDAIRDGSIPRSDLVTLGEIVCGRVAGRRFDDEIVFFNSVGLGVQDAAAAESILSLASGSAEVRSVPW